MATFSDKAAARKELLNIRSAIDVSEKKRLEHFFCDAVSSLPQFKSADGVMLYSPVRGELCLLPVAELALSMEKWVAFPISLTESSELEFRMVKSLNEMKKGAYGIPEPSLASPLAIPTANTLCIVPALACDENGYRLGYGKGYYDRFLKSFSGTSLSVVQKEFFFTSLPTNETDIPVDIIVTDTGVINADRRKSKEKNIKKDI